MKHSLTETFDIEFPLFAFSHCRDVVAAVSRNGGFGVLGAVELTPEELRVELDWIAAHTNGRPLVSTSLCLMQQLVKTNPLVKLIW